jgi:hypothetical protein
MPTAPERRVSPALACLALVGTGVLAFLFLEGRRELIGSPLLLLPFAAPLPFACLLVPTALAALAAALPSARRPDALRWLLLLAAGAAAAVAAGVSPARAPERLLALAGALLVHLAAVSLGARLAGWLGLRPEAPAPDADAAENAGTAAGASRNPDGDDEDLNEAGSAPRGPTALETVALAWGLGLAALGGGVLLLGAAGLLYRAVAWALLALAILSGPAPARRLLDSAWGEARAGARGLGPAGWAALGLLAAGVVSLLPGAFHPPLDYDVLSYHLQLPREYIAAGAIRVLPHSPFSAFPQATEMLWLLSLLLGGEGTGVWIAKLVNAGVLPLLLLAAGLPARRIARASGPGGATGALAAAALALAAWQTVALAMKLYVELLMGAWMMLALLAVLLAWDAPRRFGRRAALAGLLAGAAASAKYTGLLYAGAPVAALLLLGPAGRIGLRRRVAGAVLAGALCWAVLAPWLLRNAVETGNPVAPLWNRAFGVAEWTPAQEARFRAAHRARDHALREMARQAYRVAIGGSRAVFPGDDAPTTGTSLGALGILFAPLLLLLHRRRGASFRAAWVAAWLAGVFLLWFLLTHRFERFFHQGYLLGCVLSGAGLAAFLRWRGRLGGARTASGVLLAAGLLFAGLNLGAVLAAQWTRAVGPHGETTVLRVLLGAEPPEALLAVHAGNWPLREAVGELPAGSETLLLGTADPFWLPESVRYATVFARHPLLALAEETPDAAALAARLRALGVTHLAIHWPELARLHATHSRAFALSSGAQERIRTLLARDARPLSVPGIQAWRIDRAAAENDRLRRLLEDWPVLFPHRHPAGPYGLRPIELFALRGGAPPSAGRTGEGD